MSAIIPARPQSWLSRNTPFAIALACVAVLVMGCLFVASLFTVVTVALRSSDAYQQALTAAQHDPSVIAALGSPVRPGLLTTGELRANGDDGVANLAIPVSGPRGSGTLHVRAEKSAGKWTFRQLSVDVAGRPTPVDLLGKP